ncbi:1900_t:CDS:2 [Funneliformis mosseae]|uniref:1900_t:CDS:1 n=1 Tax=Funneliformis mosseae TaxID=27381 RepID=A0A9N9GJP4_FUNMO|nr:1900_t:CDS:2 [Funneliformis mosseae]
MPLVVYNLGVNERLSGSQYAFFFVSSALPTFLACNWQAILDIYTRRIIPFTELVDGANGLTGKISFIYMTTMMWERGNTSSPSIVELGKKVSIKKLEYIWITAGQKKDQGAAVQMEYLADPARINCGTNDLPQLIITVSSSCHSPLDAFNKK